MRIKEFLTNDRAVSPVVGVALLIAITVILAAVIGGVVLGIGTGGVDTPQAQLQAEYNDSAATGDAGWVIFHNGGEPLPADEVVFEDGDGEVAIHVTEDDFSEANEFDNGEFNAGDTLYIEGDESDGELTILWEDPNSDSTTVLETFEA